MSELERARRLPVFVDEDQWRRAFEAAKNEVDLLIASGELNVPDTWGNLAATGLAHRIASAALRAAAQDDEGDISDVPGVSVDEIRNHTRSNHGRGTLPDSDEER